MILRLSSLLAVVLLITPSLVSASAPDGFVQTRGTQIVDGSGQSLLLRGINLGNWFVAEGYMWHFKRDESHRQINDILAELVGDEAAAAFWREWYDRYITLDDIRHIRRLGFDHVRVPLHHKLLIGATGTSDFSGPGWALLDRLIDWCRAEGVYVLLDLHAAPGGQTGTNIDDSSGYPHLFDSADAQERTVALWREIARRYRDEKIVLGYDLLNEPIAHFFDTERLNPLLAPLYRRLVTAIREVDPHHVIFIGGAQWNTNFEAAGEPFAPNLVYTFHTYWTEPTVKAIERYLAFREKHQVPLYLGESGENKNEWIQQFRELLETHDIGWCFWPYKKVHTVTGVLTIVPPPGWETVLAYAEAPRCTFPEIRAARPDPAVVARALDGLLQNLAVERCQLNEGYVRALGLNILGSY